MQEVVYQSSIKRKIILTQERQEHILYFHPDLKPYIGYITEVLQIPNEINRTFEDDKVLIFYKFFDKILNGKYIAVAVKINQRNFILTSYLTDKIKTGRKYE